MLSWDKFIQEKTQQLPNLRTWRAKSEYNQRYLQLTEQKLLNFVSNDYLGLNGDSRLIKALQDGATRYGSASTGAPSMSGYSQEHAKLSANLAAWLGFADCLLFNSGYQLNVSLFSALADSNTHIWFAKNSHASHIDGILLAKAKFTTFTPAQISSMVYAIEADRNKLHIILCEGSFSMDGSCNYLAQLLELKQKLPQQILLIIDDAHGVGALGQSGYGTLEQQGLDHRQVDLYIGTLGKAFASHGGFIVGNAALIYYLRHSVRSQIFSTMLPPAQAAVSNAALAIIQSDEGIQLRDKLAQNIATFKQFALTSGINIYQAEENISAIQLVMLNDLSQLNLRHQHLLDRQILVGKIAYPTVAKNAPRLRISLTSTHTYDDIAKLVATLAGKYHQ
ncbi:MAG TPA: aminotransferase class I/II-fold pyridoxal phosphate-dependent enzyme [Burkholderiales bacterium]|nr:aminotransferase class I/II-fold pyridoxal phosphate-dependent enzyme [Burkholderiales bacterium]